MRFYAGLRQTASAQSRASAASLLQLTLVSEFEEIHQRQIPGLHRQATRHFAY